MAIFLSLHMVFLSCLVALEEGGDFSEHPNPDGQGLWGDQGLPEFV